MVKIELGKFYKARDGRKIGPIEKGEQWTPQEGQPWPFAFGDNHFDRNGYSCFGGDGLNNRRDDDLIEEWKEEVMEPKFKVGDRVANVRGDTATIMEISSSEGVKVKWDCVEGFAWVMNSFLPESTFELITPKPKSPVVERNVTVKEIVPGVYGRVEVKPWSAKPDELVFGLTSDSDGKAHFMVTMLPQELRQAAEVFNQLADYLEEKK